jgi:HSP20 family protein
MPLIPWKPFDELENFFEGDNWVFPVKLGGPAMDVYETDKEVIAELNLPGMDPEKVNISVENQVLKVSGASEEKKEEKKKGYWRREIRRGSFERSVSLPVPVRKDKVDAVYDKGVLKIVMPKTEKKPSQAKKIKIKTKK